MALRDNSHDSSSWDSWLISLTECSSIKIFQKEAPGLKTLLAVEFRMARHYSSNQIQKQIDIPIEPDRRRLSDTRKWIFVVYIIALNQNVLLTRFKRRSIGSSTRAIVILFYILSWMGMAPLSGGFSFRSGRLRRYKADFKSLLSWVWAIEQVHWIVVVDCY